MLYWEDDIRFTRKDGNVYAFIMKPDTIKTAVIKTFKPEETVSTVELLGYGSVNFMQHSGILVIDLPEKRDKEYPNALKISFSRG